MCADDDEHIHLFLRAVLEISPVVMMKSFYNGKDAYEEFQKVDYDLIITDLSMPEMTGLDFMRALSQSKTKFKIPPVVVMSSMSDSSLIMKCLNAGVADYIIKPAEPSRIRSTVFGLLRLDNTGKPLSHRTLSSFMGEMTLTKASGKLLLTDGDAAGEMVYEDGKLKQIRFGAMNGLEALEEAKKSKFLQISFVASDAATGVQIT